MLNSIEAMRGALFGRVTAGHLQYPSVKILQERDPIMLLTRESQMPKVLPERQPVEHS